MSDRLFNFSAGPAMLPVEVLEASAKALVNFKDKGFGIGEVSHRGKEFDEVIDEALARCRSLLQIPDTHDIVLVQGGATQAFSTIPMNFLQGSADYLVSGEWSAKAAKVAGAAYKVNVVASSEATNFDRCPDAAAWKLDANASYFHVCSNETVHGHRLVEWPKHPNLVVDASSEIMSRPHPIGRTALVYAGAQKNLGVAGLVLVIVRKDLYPRIAKSVPAIFSFAKHAEAKSCLNTPPTFGVYMLLETFRWLEKQGGLAAMEARNTEKASLIYSAIDGSNGYYVGTVADKAQRSHMNITFKLPDEPRTEAFIKEAAKLGMISLKGYRTVGGIRASTYNAMPVQGCRKLAEFMRDFQRRNP